MLQNKKKEVLESMIKEHPDMIEYYKDALEEARKFSAKEKYSKKNLDAAKQEAMKVFEDVEHQLNKIDSGA